MLLFTCDVYFGNVWQKCISVCFKRMICTCFSGADLHLLDEIDMHLLEEVDERHGSVCLEHV